MSKKIFILCEGRHETPARVTDGAIFPEFVASPMDFSAMKNVAIEKIGNATEVEVYVTGLTPATTSVIDACLTLEINLTLWHYDREKNDYKAQFLRTCPWSDYCAFCGAGMNGFICPNCGAS